MNETIIKSQYLDAVRKLFANDQATFDQFMGRWNMGDFRGASLIVDEAIKSLHVAPPSSFAPVDEAFYWAFVN